jgi:hypothetical protein
VRRDRAVVDDPAAARRLRLHQHERLLRAQEDGGQVDVDDGLPLLHRELLERDRRRAGAGVVEEDVEAAVLLLDGGEERLDGGRIGGVGRHDEDAVGAIAGGGARRLERVGAAARRGRRGSPP